MTSETYRGVVHAGTVVFLADQAPLAEGTEVIVTPVTGGRGTSAAVLAAMEGSIQVGAAWVDELERLIAAGRRPPTHSNPFQEGQ